jgi:hypothetical protein
MGREHLTYYPADRDVCDRSGHCVSCVMDGKILIHEREWSVDEVGRLFAAAPELLEAAEGVLELLTDEYDGAPDSPRRKWGTYIATLERAVAKAKGKEVSRG